MVGLNRWIVSRTLDAMRGGAAISTVLAPTYQGKIRTPPVPKVKNSRGAPNARSLSRKPSTFTPHNCAASG